MSVTPEEKVLWEKATSLAEDNLEARKLFEKLKTNKMQLKGKRVLLNKPEVKESQFELSEADKLALEMDMRKTWTRLEIYAVGDEVESVKPGDHVYIGITGLQASEAVELEDGIVIVRNEDGTYTDGDSVYESFSALMEQQKGMDMISPTVFTEQNQREI